jgi:hypothetical protein
MGAERLSGDDGHAKIDPDKGVYPILKKSKSNQLIGDIG